MADDLSDAGLNLSDLTDAMNNPAGVDTSQLASALGVDPSQLQSVLGDSAGDPSSQPLVPVQNASSNSLANIITNNNQVLRKTASLARVASQIIAAVGFSGFGAVAQALGVPIADALRAWALSKGVGKRRRRRGITSRDLTTTRRTIRKVSGMYHNLERSFPRHHSSSRAMVTYPKRKK